MVTLPAEAEGSFLKGHRREYVEVYTPDYCPDVPHLLRLFPNDVPVEGAQVETHFHASQIGRFLILPREGKLKQQERNIDFPLEDDESKGWTLWYFRDDAHSYKTCAISRARGTPPDIQRTFVRTLEQLAEVKPFLNLRCFVGSET